MIPPGIGRKLRSASHRPFFHSVCGRFWETNVGGSWKGRSRRPRMLVPELNPGAALKLIDLFPSKVCEFWPEF